MRVIRVAVGLLWCLLLVRSPGICQEEDPQAPPGLSEEEKQELEKAAREREEALARAEREKRVLALFNATTAKFEKSHVVLTYDFGTRLDHLLADWRPPLEETSKRVRWSVTGEEPLTTVIRNGIETTVSRPGIMISDHGQWLHKAKFLGEAEVHFRVYSLSQPRPGTIIAPVFYQLEKKRGLGAHCGQQVVRLSGVKPVLARPAHPKGERFLPVVTVLQWIGFRYDGKVLECWKDGKAVASSSEVPKLTDGFDAGHVGLAWNGAVKCYVRQATIRGLLDPDWVAEALGEKAAKR